MLQGKYVHMHMHDQKFVFAHVLKGFLCISFDDCDAKRAV